jgi:hypothetical protein
VALRNRGRAVGVPATPSGVFVVLGDGDLRATDVDATVRYPGRRAVRLGTRDWHEQEMAFPRGYDRRLTETERRTLPPLPRPLADRTPTIEARTPDPNGGLPFGITAAPGDRGTWCLPDEPGRIVGNRVGVVDDALGLLSDFGALNVTCGTQAWLLSRRRPLAYGLSNGASSQDPVAGRVARRTLRGVTILHGRALPDVTAIRVASPRDVRTVIPSPRAHAFLIAYDGTFPGGKLVLTSTLRDGSTHRQVVPIDDQ